MSELNQIVDDSNPGKYFTQMLNMAEDELGPYEYRLLAHYKRWASTGPTIEGLRKTAKLCKMSPQRVSDAREKLIEAGYILYQPPTEAQKAKGIAGVVRVIDRMEENVKRYTPKKAPVQNSTQVDSSSSVQNSVHPPVQKIAQYEEPKKEELKNISALKSSAGSAPPKPATTVPTKQRERDVYFDTVAYGSFGLTPESANGSSQRIAKISWWLKGKGKTDIRTTPADIDAVQRFYSEWWPRKFPNVNPPRDLGKFIENYLAFEAQDQKPVETGVSDFPIPDDVFDVWMHTNGSGELSEAKFAHRRAGGVWDDAAETAWLRAYKAAKEGK